MARRNGTRSIPHISTVKAAAMSTTPRRLAHATPSPTKRLTPVVEIPVPRTRSSVKRTSSAHLTSAEGRADAKRQRRNEEPIAGPSKAGRDGGSPIQHRDHTLRSSGMLPKLANGLRSSEQAVASTSKLPPPIASTSRKPFALPGQEKATCKKLGKVNDLLSGRTSRAVEFGFDDQSDARNNESLHREDRVVQETASSPYSMTSLPIIESSHLRRVDHASLPSSGYDNDSMQIDEGSPPRRKQNQESHKLPSPAPSTSTTASISQLPSQASLPAHTPTKQRRVAQLVTPTSSKKRTPTKAVKKKAEEQDDFLSAHNASFNIFPTPSTTPDKTLRHSNSYPKKDIISVLQKVLEQLSSPCSSIHTPTRITPTDPGYKSWLASQPCLSQAHAAAEKDVRNTIDRTIRDGEGNCMLVIGERGIGKSAIIERSLKTLEGVYGKNAFLTVKLSGLVQRDDKSAVREIARQLCSSSYSEEVEEGSQFVGSFRDSTGFPVCRLIRVIMLARIRTPTFYHPCWPS